MIVVAPQPWQSAARVIRLVAWRTKSQIRIGLPQEPHITAPLSVVGGGATGLRRGLVRSALRVL
jgi:hypothetical protein